MSRRIRVLTENLVFVCLTLCMIGWGTNAKAQAVPDKDSLWAWTAYYNEGVKSVCVNPTSENSTISCFKEENLDAHLSDNLITTDGINVYMSTETAGYALQCPIVGYGTGCTEIVVGPFGNYSNKSITAIAVADGYIWTGQNDGAMYRCRIVPIGAEAGCIKLNDAGIRYIKSMVLSNGYLYAGLTNYGGSGLMWRCDPWKVDGCEDFNHPGSTDVNSLAVGAGSLWAGLGNGIVWRCDLEIKNRCDDWNKASGVIQSVSYDSQGKLGVAVKSDKSGVVWLCPTATKNSCVTLTADSARFVTAYAGRVFATVHQENQAFVDEHYIYSGTLSSDKYFSERFKGSKSQSLNLLYIPVGGPSTLGSARIKVPLRGVAAALRRICSRNDKLLTDVTVQGPYSKIDRSLDLCKAQTEVPRELDFHALDAGWYRVTVSVNGLKDSKTFYVQKNEKMKEVVVNLRTQSVN